EFHPQRAEPAVAFANETSRIGSLSVNPNRSGQKFARCRAIAVEADEAPKIHRRVESSVHSRSGNRNGYIAPRTEMERQLCELWQKLLRIERVGVEDNFFDLGGHSLLAVRLFVEAEKITGRKFPLVTLFQAPTIGQLARILSEKHCESSH